MARIPRVLPTRSVSAFQRGPDQSVNAFDALAQVVGTTQQALQPLFEAKLKEGGANSVYRDENGQLRVDEMSLLAGEMAAIHNAAAHSTYLSRVNIDARERMTAMAAEFDGNPDGFDEAASEYRSQVLSTAPDVLAADVETMLSREALSAGNGIRIRKIKQGREDDNRQTKLTMGMLGQDAAEIFAQEGASEEFQSKVNEIQSIADYRVSQGYDVPADREVFIRQMTDQAEAARLSRIETDAEKVIEAADAGLVHELEDSVLADVRGTEFEAPVTVAVNARNMAPDFARLSPDQQQVVIEQLEAAPAVEGSADAIGKLREIQAATKKAIAKDPIATARERQPGVVKDVTLDDPRSMNQRVQSAAQLNALGLNGEAGTGSFRLFEAEEVKAFRSEIDAMGPAEKMQAVQNMVLGFGPAAVKAIGEIGLDDTFTLTAQLTAVGADPEIGLTIFAGAESEKAAPLDKAVRDEATQEFLASLRQAVPPEVLAQLQPSVIQAAGAYYDGRGLPDGIDTDKQKTAYQEALSAALGGRGGVGGLAEVNGRPILLPPTVTADEADAAFEEAFAGLDAAAGVGAGAGRAGVDVRALRQAGVDAFNDLMAKASVSGNGVPLAGNEPLQAEDAGAIAMVAVGHDRYQLRLTNGTGQQIALVNSVSGQPYELSLTRLVDLTR